MDNVELQTPVCATNIQTFRTVITEKDGRVRLNDVEVVVKTGLYQSTEMKFLSCNYSRLGKANARMLNALVQSIGEVIPREDMMKLVWGERCVTLGSISVAIHKLRSFLKELNIDDLVIRNFNGIGYGLFYVSQADT